MNASTHDLLSGFVVTLRYALIVVIVVPLLKIGSLSGAEPACYADAMRKGRCHLRDGEFDLAISAFTDAIRFSESCRLHRTRPRVCGETRT